METFLFLIALIAVGVFSWFGAEVQEKRKSRILISDLEQKMHRAEAKALGFREQYTTLTKDLESVKRELEQERTNRQATVSGFQYAFRKGVFLAGASFLAFGIVAGGTVAGFWTHSAVHAKTRQQMMDLDIIARVARMNADHFKSELEKIKIEYSQLRKMLDEERIAKTVALTKLEIILENLVADKWKGGFSLDPGKFLQEWKRPPPAEAGPASGINSAAVAF